MEKLSEEGKLYLNDYLILSEALNDTNRFLNTVVEKAHDIILEEKNDLEPTDFKINLWENKSNKGHLQVQFISLKESEFFRKNLIDIYVIYKDIRNTTDLKSSNTSKIYVYSPTVSSKLENKLSKISMEKFNNDIYTPEVVEFNLDSSSQSAEKVAKRILEKCNSISQLIETINSKSIE